MGSSKKKVVILGSAYPLRGGLAAYNEHLARAYLQNGDDVEIVTFSLQYPGFLFPGKTQYSSEAPPADLKIISGLNSVNPISWIAIGKKIRKINPDLLIIKFWLPFMGPALGTVARIVRKNKHTKVISILDNIIPHEKRPGDRVLAHYFVKYADGFVAMSDEVMNDLSQFDTKKPRAFCPHPLYDFGMLRSKTKARETLGLDQEKKFLLFFGFIRDYKGLDLLLKAMADKRLKERDIHLLVAGEFYTDSKPYFNLIEELEIGERVHMSNDFIPDSKVGDYFNAADLVVQPYKDATQSGVTQIAYHFEKPMVTTNVGGLAEIVPDGRVGYVVRPDEKEIAGAVLKYFDGNKESEFVQNIRIEKQKYSWERMLKTINKLAEHDLS
jgi:glycosyltransferase involved in cell wall biosynthesis